MLLQKSTNEKNSLYHIKMLDTI